LLGRGPAATWQLRGNNRHFVGTPDRVLVVDARDRPVTWRLARTICLCAPLLAGAFAFLHTGARADDVCMSERFVPADGLSLWPPGTHCAFGEPAETDVLVNPWLALALVAVLGGAVASLRRRPGARKAQQFVKPR
jgi:hypothetical protein